MTFLENCILEFRKMKSLAERAISVLSDDELTRCLDPESNSVNLIAKHLAGNMRSRWTEFLTSDGEKPDRNRDTEFEEDEAFSRRRMLERWEEGWRILFAALEPLREEDLERTVMIRGEPHTVRQAILRQLTHYAYHVGQIVFLAKHLAGGRWESLSVPRGHSEEFNRRMGRS